MPRILGAAHAFPTHRVSQQQAKQAVRTIFAGKIPELDRLMTVFDNSRIAQRYLVMPLDWYLQPRSLEERNQVFVEQGMSLLRQACEQVLGSSDINASQVAHLIYVNSTGHATPSLDARLINELNFSVQTSRLPIWGLGCAGGAAGLSRARDYCLAHPRAKVLLTALECCSLTLVVEDLSKKNLVGTSLFSDGAAAVLVAGDEAGGPGPEIVAARSQLFPDSYDIMGWKFSDHGMELVLSPRLPMLIKKELPGMVDRFLSDHGLAREDLQYYIAHPGGAKVLDAVSEALGVRDKDLHLSEELLNRQGNISSVSVLVVLENWLSSKASSTQGYGLLLAFGPGFSAELMLIKV
ncbi:MAG: 3-oxoacyl-[acyl-carrier-protein] synthase III C-terminal domain-containing protein [Desulfuromonadales bacterium]